MWSYCWWCTSCRLKHNLCFSLQNEHHLKPAAPNLQHTTNWEQYDRCGNSLTQSQAPDDGYINLLTPNDPYMGRTAPLTSKRCILYIYSTNIGTEYFKHALYFPFFFSSKCSLFHNANLFGSCIIHILYTGCAKIKKNNSGAKRLISETCWAHKKWNKIASDIKLVFHSLTILVFLFISCAVHFHITLWYNALSGPRHFEQSHGLTVICLCNTPYY